MCSKLGHLWSRTRSHFYECCRGQKSCAVGLKIGQHVCLNPFLNKPWFCLQYKSFGNTMGKGEIAHYEQFLLFPQCFLTFWITFSHVYQISNCRLQTLSVWEILKFVVWERVNKILHEIKIRSHRIINYINI